METLVANNWRALLDLAQTDRDRVAQLVQRDCRTDEGCLLNGYLLLSSEPDQAKDLLARARRSPDRDLAQQAAIYEARAYEYLGQHAEGRILIREFLEQDIKPEYRAQALFVFAVLHNNNPKRALGILDGIALDCLPPTLKARVFTLRAKLQYDLDHLDHALIEYAGAAAYFEDAGDMPGVAHTLNNRAHVERKLGLIREAHASVDRALSLTADSYPFMAVFLDTKAQILLTESRFREAESVAVLAVRLARGIDRKAVLSENLCTLGQALAGQQKYPSASEAFADAKDLALDLVDHELLFRITAARKAVAQDFVQTAELEMAELALIICDGSYRAAARKLGLSHTGIIKLLARNSRQWKPKKPQSIIRKPLK